MKKDPEFSIIFPAIKISLLYLLFGGLWILLSDWALLIIFEDAQMQSIAQTHKGWFFVLVTGLLLFGLLRRELLGAEKERQEAHSALYESERKLSTLMANLPGMAFRCRTDPYWSMLFISQGCQELTGYAPEKLLEGGSVNFISLVHPEDSQGVRAEITAKLQEKKSYRIHYRLIASGGEIKHVLEQGQGIFSEDGRFLFIEGFISDVSRQYHDEQLIRSQIQELKKVNTELDQFSHTVAHDLRSPLLSVQGFLDLIKLDIKEDNKEGINRSLQRIQHILGGMHELLEDLLRLSRLGRVAGIFEPVDMNELVSELKEQMNGMIEKYHAIIDIQPDLGMVMGDKGRLAVVFQNLLENAFKFQAEGATPVIKIGRRKDQDRDVFYVADNGLGIEAEKRQEIFTLFTRLHPHLEGTGLGLALVDRIIKAHEGQVWVESEGSGKGSVFCFSLGPQASSS